MKNTYRLPIRVNSFAEMSKILEAFHTLVEEFKERTDAPTK